MQFKYKKIKKNNPSRSISNNVSINSRQRMISVLLNE